MLAGDVLGAELVQERVEGLSALVEDVLETRVVVEEPARHELGRGDRVAGLGVHRHDRDEDAVAGQLLAVAQHEAFRVADLGAVDEHHAGRDLVDDLAVVGLELEHVAVLEDEDVLVGHARLAGQLGVLVLHAVLAVDRDQEPGSREVQHHLEVFLGGVAADVDAAALAVDHRRADLEQAVDGGRHAALVAGDRLGRDDDRVAFVQLHLRMVVEGHARERRERLALAAGREDEDLLGPVLVDLRELDHRALGHLEVAEVAGDVGVLDHRAAGEGELAPVQVGDGDRLLDAVDVRGEAGHDHAAFGLGEDPVEGVADGALRGGRARSLGVGRVAEQREDALLTEPGEGVHVGDAAVDRRVVEAVVAGEHHGAEVGAEHDRERVGDAVAGGDEGEVERPELQARRVADLVQLDALEQAVLLELGLDEREREAAAVDGPVEPPEHERQRPLVVLVAVRDHEGEHVLLALDQPADVGEHEVDAEHVLAGELDAAVEHDDLAAVLDRGHVLADLAEAPEGDDTYGVFTHGDAFSRVCAVAAGLRRR